MVSIEGHFLKKLPIHDRQIKSGFRYFIGEMKKAFWRDKIETNISKLGSGLSVAENWLWDVSAPNF